jgi:hypothetical protein
MLGYVQVYTKGWAASRYTKKCPAKQVCDFAKAHFPEFHFTGVMVNEGGSALHVDTQNCGESYIVAFGDFEGGELWQYPDCTLDVRAPVKCDGRLPHMTLPFKGERYSLVFFNLSGNHQAASPADALCLQELGFGRPETRPETKAAPRKDLLPQAAALLTGRGLVVGDWQNSGIKSTVCVNRSRKTDGPP